MNGPAESKAIGSMQPERRYERATLAVRIGGWRIGRWQVGGGIYEVRPLSVFRALNFFGALNAVGELVAERARSLDAVMTVALPRMLRPLVWASLDTPVKPRHKRRITDAQTKAVLAAMREVNDVEFMEAQLFPKDGASAGRASWSTTLYWLGRELATWPHEVTLKPMQEVLQAVEDLRELRRLERGEKLDDGWVETTPEEQSRAAALFHALGWNVVH